LPLGLIAGIPPKTKGARRRPMPNCIFDFVAVATATVATIATVATFATVAGQPA